MHITEFFDTVIFCYSSLTFYAPFSNLWEPTRLFNSYYGANLPKEILKVMQTELGKGQHYYITIT